MKGTESGGWPWGSGVQVIHRDPNGLIAVNKPAGILSHPNRPGVAPKAVVKLPYAFELEAFTASSGRKLYLCNRLDSPTSGILLLCEDESLARSVKQAFRQHRVEKTYLALVKGKPRPESQTWSDRLSRKRDRGTLRVKAGQAGDTRAITRMRVDASWRVGKVLISRIFLFPETGRTHQLRVQTAQRGFPIIGDKTYGDFSLNRELADKLPDKRLYLHATSLGIDDPPVKFAVQSQPPPAFFEGYAS